MPCKFVFAKGQLTLPKAQGNIYWCSKLCSVSACSIQSVSLHCIKMSPCSACCKRSDLARVAMTALIVRHSGRARCSPKQAFKSSLLIKSACDWNDLQSVVNAKWRFRNMAQTWSCLERQRDSALLLLLFLTLWWRPSDLKAVHRFFS